MKVLYVSFVDWFWIKQRPQHITEGLVRDGIDVDFFSPINWRASQATPHSETDDTSKMQFAVNDHLRVTRRKLLPLGRFTVMQRLNTWRMKRALRPFFADNHYDAIILTHPSQQPFIPDDQLSKVVYDCMDDYVHFTNNATTKRDWQTSEATIIAHAFATVVSSDYLGEQLRARYGNQIQYTVVNNGVEFKQFGDPQPAPEKAAATSIPQVVTYVGTISSWFDMRLIQRAAEHFPQVAFDLFGPVEAPHDEVTAPNVTFHGSIPYATVAQRLADSGVLVMPFHLNEIVRAVNPVKLYEYLASGRPVIARRYGETEKFSEVVDLYDTSEEFLALIADALTPAAQTPAMRAKRIAFAAANDWQDRADRIAAIVRQIPRAGEAKA